MEKKYNSDIYLICAIFHLHILHVHYQRKYRANKMVISAAEMVFLATPELSEPAIWGQPPTTHVFLPLHLAATSQTPENKARQLAFLCCTNLSSIDQHR